MGTQGAHQLREGENAGGQLGECQLDGSAGRCKEVFLVQEDPRLAVGCLPDLDAVESLVGRQQCALCVHQLVLGPPPILGPASPQRELGFPLFQDSTAR